MTAGRLLRRTCSPPPLPDQVMAVSLRCGKTDPTTLFPDHEVAVDLRCGKASTKKLRYFSRLDPVFVRDSRGGSIIFSIKEESTRSATSSPVCKSPNGKRPSRVEMLLPPAPAPAKLPVHARGFKFARKFNVDLFMAAAYVQIRTKRRLRCPDQPDPRPDRIPNPNPNLTLWGARGLLSRSAGELLGLCANLKTLYIRAINAWSTCPSPAEAWLQRRLSYSRLLYQGVLHRRRAPSRPPVPPYPPLPRLALERLRLRRRLRTSSPFGRGNEQRQQSVMHPRVVLWMTRGRLNFLSLHRAPRLRRGPYEALGIFRSPLTAPHRRGPNVR